MKDRLTEVSKVLGGYYAKQSFVGYSYEKEIDKLGQLEDIEEELGIDLITLFKALMDGIYIESDNVITNIVELTYEPKHIGNEWQFNYTWTLKDYGKTWALTKEELDNEQEKK